MRKLSLYQLQVDVERILAAEKKKKLENTLIKRIIKKTKQWKHHSWKKSQTKI